MPSHPERVAQLQYRTHGDRGRYRLRAYREANARFRAETGFGARHSCGVLKAVMDTNQPYALSASETEGLIRGLLVVVADD